MSEQEIRRRADELEKTGKGLARLPGQQLPGAADIMPVARAGPTEILEHKIKAQCKTCYQEHDLPAGTRNWKCDVCGTENTA